MSGIISVLEEKPPETTKNKKIKEGFIKPIDKMHGVCYYIYGRN